MTSTQANQLQALYDRFYSDNLPYEVYIAYYAPTANIGNYVVLVYDGNILNKYGTYSGASNSTVLDNDYINIYHTSLHNIKITLKKDCKVKINTDQLDIIYHAGDIISSTDFYNYNIIKITFNY